MSTVSTTTAMTTTTPATEAFRGWLVKKSKKKRFFVVSVSDSCVWWFAEAANADAAFTVSVGPAQRQRLARGCLPLCPMTAVDVAMSVVTVRSPGARPYPFEAATSQEAAAFATAVVSVAASSKVRQSLVKGTLLVSVASPAAPPPVKPKPSFVTLRGISVSWAASADTQRALGELQLALGTVEWTGETTLLLRGAATAGVEAATAVEFCAESHAVAMGWWAAFVRSIAFANEVQSNFTPSAYREVTSVKVIVDVILRGSRYSLRLPSSLTPLAILTEAVRFIQAHFVQVGSQQLTPDLFILKACGFELSFSALDQPLSSDPSFRLLLRAFVLPRLCIAYKSTIVKAGVPLQNLVWRRAPNTADFIRHESVTEILGEDYIRMIVVSDLSRIDSEVNVVRRNFARFRLEHSELLQVDKPPQYIGSIPISKAAIPTSLELSVDWQSIGTKKLIVPSSMTAEELSDLAVKKYAQLGTPIPPGTEYILKVRGIRSFLIGPIPLSSYDCVRRSLIEKQPLFLSLVPTPEHWSTRKSDSDACLLVDRILASNLPDQSVSAGQKFLWEMKQPFRFKAVGACSLDTPRFEALREKGSKVKIEVQLHAGLFFGGAPVCEPSKTPFVPCTCERTSGEPRTSAVWDEWVPFPIPLFNLPLGARLCITLFAKKHEDREAIPIGWVNFLPISYDNTLWRGSVSLRLWKDEVANPIGTFADNVTGKRPPVIDLEFEEFDGPVICWPYQPLETAAAPPATDQAASQVVVTPIPQATPQAAPSATATLLAPQATPPVSTSPKILAKEDQAFEQWREAMLAQDALVALTVEQRCQLWKHRARLASYPEALAKVLLSVDWAERSQAREARALLDRWAPITPVQALQLLDWEFADPDVRRYAVKSLEPLSDDDLSLYLQQLVWVIKYEPFHDSPLARFLILRALRNKDTIGHPLFWFVRSEMIGDPALSIRYGLILEAYLLGCGNVQIDMIQKQIFVSRQLSQLANTVKQAKKERRSEVLFGELHKIKLPDTFVLPLHPSLECSGLVISGCRLMKSFLSPLFLSFRNSDPRGEPIQIIYKLGDDLRQDILVLQMLRIMDKVCLPFSFTLAHFSPPDLPKIWNADGLDLRLSCYGVVATGLNEGMIEVVRNAETLGNITRSTGSQLSVFQPDLLSTWLRQQATGGQNFESQVDNFVRSCAGYCVATFVLGIGDRHNDNIMLCPNGKLFHIDFGHFLGHFLKKFGIERETAPFVFTPQFAQILGGEDSAMYKFFEGLCIIAFHTIRRHANVFINLILLMLSIGLPELNSVQDVLYLRDHLMLELSETDSAVALVSLTRQSLKTTRTQFNDLFHLLANR